MRKNWTRPAPAPATSWSRRQFLGALAGLGFATACTTSSSGGASSEPTQRYDFAPLFPPENSLAAGRHQRIPLAIVDEGAPFVGGPDELTIEIRSGDRVVGTTTVVAQSLISSLRYYPVRTELDEPGIYDLVSTTAGWEISQPVQLFDPADVDVVAVGTDLSSLDTPTTARPEGVDPLCSRDPNCGLHEVSVPDHLEAGRPVVLAVATPAYCQTAFCGPSLGHVIAAAAENPGLGVVHAEVYRNARELGGNLSDPELATSQVVDELGLTFEPSILFIGADGVLIERLDHVAGRAEIDEVITALM